MCVGPLAYTSGLGLASQAVKKGGPLALVSPIAALVAGGASKGKPQYGGGAQGNPTGTMSAAGGY